MDARIKVLATQHNTPTKMRIDGDSEKHIGNRVGRSISKLVQHQRIHGCLGNNPGRWQSSCLVCKARSDTMGVERKMRSGMETTYFSRVGRIDTRKAITSLVSLIALARHTEVVSVHE